MGRRPLAVGITGGIGAGKSETLKAFARHGAATVSSDEIVHRMLREDAEVKQAIIEHFGKDVLDGKGEIDRGSVGAIVFNDRQALAWLEQLLHPRVSAVYLRWRDELAEQPDPPAICATEVPLLYESGAEQWFDAIVAVTADPKLRASRFVRPDLELREARLLPDEEKLARADFAFVNDGSLEELDAFVSGVIEQLTR